MEQLSNTRGDDRPHQQGDDRPHEQGHDRRHEPDGNRRRGGTGQPYVIAVALLAGIGLAIGGVWALAAPRSFSDFTQFPHHQHFVHDLGAFQIGLAVTLLLAVIWADALTVALSAMLVSNSIHAVNHAVDLDLGGRTSDAWGLAAVSVLVALAFLLRWRRLGYVVGAVSGVSSPSLAPYTRQKTILLTTYRRDGTPRAVPVSIAVDGDHAFVRSFEKAAKTRRLRHTPHVRIAPCTARGKPTGPPTHARMRRVEGADARRAARLLARKHPFLHGIVVPFTHRMGRAKTGRTVYFVLTPATHGTEVATADAAVGGG